MSARRPSLGHRLFFWFYLATLSMVLPEVTTLNAPIPWIHPLGLVVGYPAYGLHVLALAGLMYRWPIGGYRTLLAYGGLFGLYEAYWTKQLWNPTWGVDVAASVGGGRLFHTLVLVFFLHPLLAFVLPLLLAERLLLAPDPADRSAAGPTAEPGRHGRRVRSRGLPRRPRRLEPPGPGRAVHALVSIAVLSVLGLV